MLALTSAWPIEGRRQTMIIASAAFGLATLLVGLAAPATGAELKGSFRGNAFGTSANAVAGPIAATLGRNAFQPCPCNGTGGKEIANTVTDVSAGDDGDVLKAGALRATVRTTKTSTNATVTTGATVTGLRIFGGLIEAEAVKAVAKTTATAANLATSFSDSEFVELKVAGRAVSGDVKENTTLALPGLGTVTLKKVTRGGNGRSLASINVDMLVVDVKVKNAFGLEVGVQIIVAHAFSGYSRTMPESYVGGSAYITDANTKVGDDLQNRIGRAALVTIGCEGTGGRTRENSIAQLEIARLLTLNEGVTTAFGGRSGGATVARTTATLEGASLLNGLLSFGAVSAVAQEKVEGGVRARSTEGSFVAALRIAGTSFGKITAANRKLPLPGIGYVIVNEQIVPSPTAAGRTVVNGLHIVVTLPNLLRLPVGSEIIIAHAEANAQRR